MPEEPEETFGDRLRHALRQHGVSQRELADVLSLAIEKKIQPSRISEWVNSASVPGPRTQRAIARALHISLRWLATGTGSMSDRSHDDPRIYADDHEPATEAQRIDRRLDEIGGRLTSVEELLERIVATLSALGAAPDAKKPSEAPGRDEAAVVAAVRAGAQADAPRRPRSARASSGRSAR